MLFVIFALRFSLVLVSIVLAFILLLGYSGTLGKPTMGRTKAAVLMGTQDCLLPPSELNYGQSIVSRIPAGSH